MKGPAAALAVLSLCACAGWAQPATIGTADAQRSVSREVYLQDVGAARDLLAACERDAKACDPKRVSGDEKVFVPRIAGSDVQMRWDWLRETLRKAPEAKPEERQALFTEAEQRLEDDAAEIAQVGQPHRLPVALPEAQKKAEAILAGKAFQRVEQSSWLSLQFAALVRWLDKVFSGATGLLPSSAAFGVLLQWGILVLAAVALGLWAWRSNRQQRVALVADRAASPLWHVESERWAERAQDEAERGDWREAVHSLYWAAIVMLEGQRLWRENRTRTPREYVRLLEPGSARAQLLGGLTAVLERIWYGLRPAAREDYEHARGLFDRLRSA